MAYCTETDVRMVINTKLTPTEVGAIITMSDAEIDKRLGAQTPGDELIKKLSMLMSARTIKTRQPESRAVGDWKEVHKPGEAWGLEIEQIMSLYIGDGRGVIKASEYEVIDEDVRYVRGSD